MQNFKFHILGNYPNHGQDLEQSLRFELTGKLEKADNLPHTLGADCLDFQIKSARATVCKGTDLDAYLAIDAAKRYIYATADGTAYIMSRAEYKEFCTRFGTVTVESKKNGGGSKIRFKSESKKMREWLERA